MSTEFWQVEVTQSLSPWNLSVGSRVWILETFNFMIILILSLRNDRVHLIVGVVW